MNSRFCGPGAGEESCVLMVELCICTVFRKDRGLIAKEKEIGTSTNSLLAIDN